MVSSVLLSSFCFLGKIEVNRKLTLIDLHILLFPNVFVPFSRPRYCNTTSPAILSMILPVCRTLRSWSTCVKTKCPIGIFQFGHFPSISVLLKLNCMLQFFKNTPNWPLLGIFHELLSTQNVNVARHVEWDFFCDFPTLWLRSWYRVGIPCSWIYWDECTKRCSLDRARASISKRQ